MPALRMNPLSLRRALLTLIGVALAGIPGAAARAEAPPLDAVCAAIGAALQPGAAKGVALPRAEREPLLALYSRRSFCPLWSRESVPLPPAIGLVARLLAAENDGLLPAAYDAGPLASLLLQLVSAPPTTAEDWAQLDLALSRAALRFVTHLHSGRVSPRAAGFNLHLARPEFDAGAVLEQLAAGGDLETTLAAVGPQALHFVLLEQYLSRYRTLAADPALTALPRLPAKSVKPGGTYMGAPALRRLLVTLGDLPAAASAPDTDLTLDPDLVTALQRFQRRHGLAGDGAIGRGTFAALTTPLAERVRQIALTLERWRWLPPFETPPIVVNIPQFRLFAFRTTADRKAEILQMDVIVGQTHPWTRTPVFTAEMKFVVFRPFWDVPPGILKRELLPKIRANPGYVAANGLEIVRGQGDDATRVAATPANVEALAAGALRLRQPPGDDNALGLIKFLLPNPYNVYLHGTPAHRLFAEPRRAFSHGCIRVSDPAALAALVLRNAPGEWTPEVIQAAMNGTKSQRVALALPIRVFILYGTAVPTEDGEILFFDDLYGHDRKLERLLGLKAIGRK